MGLSRLVAVLHKVGRLVIILKIDHALTMSNLGRIEDEFYGEPIEEEKRGFEYKNLMRNN